MWDTRNNVILCTLNAFPYFLIYLMLIKLCSYPLLARKASWKQCTNDFLQTYTMNKDGGVCSCCISLFSFLNFISYCLDGPAFNFLYFAVELKEYCSLTWMFALLFFLMHFTQKLFTYPSYCSYMPKFSETITDLC